MKKNKKNDGFSDPLTRGEDRKKFKQKGLSRRRKGSKSSGFVQKLDIKKNKKLLHRFESSNITYQEEDNLQTLTWMRETSQPIHDGAHRKPGEIDEAGTSGATAQIFLLFMLKYGFATASKIRGRLRE